MILKERFLCPNLCQCFTQKGKCTKCEEELESIGLYDDDELDIELGKRAIIKLGLNK
jgi:hypothetical protein